MKYYLEISSVAEAEADSVFLRLSKITSPAKSESVVYRITASDRVSVSNAKTLFISTRERAKGADQLVIKTESFAASIERPYSRTITRLGEDKP